MNVGFLHFASGLVRKGKQRPAVFEHGGGGSDGFAVCVQRGFVLKSHDVRSRRGQFDDDFIALDGQFKFAFAVGVFFCRRHRRYRQ